MLFACLEQRSNINRLQYFYSLAMLTVSGGESIQILNFSQICNATCKKTH